MTFIFLHSKRYCFQIANILTFSAPHATKVAISRLVEKVPLQELLSATEFSVRLV